MSEVKLPHAAYSEAVGKPVISGAMKEKDRVWLIEYQTCHSAMRDYQYENSVLKEDNQRLKHENAFMLRLINEQMNGLGTTGEGSPQ